MQPTRTSSRVARKRTAAARATASPTPATQDGTENRDTGSKTAEAANAEPTLRLVNAAPPHRFFPYSRRDAYPKHMKADFRRLDSKTLQIYADDYDIEYPDSISNVDLAVMLARHFDSQPPPQDDAAIEDFLSHLNTAAQFPEYDRGDDLPARPKKRRRRTSTATHSPIPLGTRVCALVGDNWIMARVVSWSSRSKMFHVEDEDADDDDSDAASRHTVPVDNVLTLTEPDSSTVVRGLRVLALFPQTTSFYAGNVVSSLRNGMVGVCFDDDEEDGIVVPERAVPLPFVLQYPHERDLA